MTGNKGCNGQEKTGKGKDNERTKTGKAQGHSKARTGIRTRTGYRQKKEQGRYRYI